MEAERHDRNTALISHLPRFLPISLLAMANQSGDDLTLQLAAGGFRDSTRLATENPAMWTDVALTNPQHIIAAIHDLQHSLDDLAQTLALGDASAIHALLETAQQQWERRFG